MSSSFHAPVWLCVAFVLFPARAVAQDSPLYVNRDYRFAVIFPAEPVARDATFETFDGASIPAREFVSEGSAERYAVTVVEFPSGRPADGRMVEHAAEQLRRRGEVLFQARADYDPGIPGRQLNIAEANGRQLRASIYMYDYRLYVAEASAPPGDLPALQFEQSIMLLDEDGNDLDVNGIDAVLAVIGRFLGLDLR